MTDFSFIILTYNEEIHISRLLNSINNLRAPVFVLDSGSTDKTVEICRQYGAIVQTNTFQNHPKQWHHALNCFHVPTQWIIALDADQVVTPELYKQLASFKDVDFTGISGIYFNRKAKFKGKWLRFGGYYPKYLLKMFRRGDGHSDLNENMDHRFIITGKCIIWRKGHIVEENLKENHIAFWIQKHNRYSDLVAEEEWERGNKMRKQSVKPRFFGTPDERVAALKSLWWRMPLLVRPFIYFFYRYFIQLGVLDGRQGLIFHFLQAFWFRFVVDIKISELRKLDNS